MRLGVWAGPAVFLADPSLATVEACLTRVLEATVLACASFPRVEADIAAASGLPTVPAPTGKKPGAEDPRAAASQGTTLIDLISAGGGVLASVRMDDHEVRGCGVRLRGAAVAPLAWVSVYRGMVGV